ncbi:hypothetical protein EMCRGX_G021382 [Ephydatia muelleri]
MQTEQSSEDVKWTTELEVALFHSMHRHKPVGINKHFHMACIQHRLQQLSGLSLTTQEIWKHLQTLYDLESLDEFENTGLQNEEKDFSLPRDFQSTEATNRAQSAQSTPAGHSASSSPVSSPLYKPPAKRKRT